MIASKSLRWQLQSYYALLLLVTSGTLAGLAIHWIKQSERHRYDSKLREVQHLIMPTLKAVEAENPEQWKLFEPIANNSSGPRPNRRHGRGHRPDFNPGDRDFEPSGRPEARRGGPPSGEGFPGRRGRPGRPDGPPGNQGFGRHGRSPRQAPRALDNLIEEGYYFGLISFEGEPLRKSSNFPDDLNLDIDYTGKKGDFIIDDKGFRHLVHREPGSTISIIGYPKALLSAYIQRRQWILIGVSSALFVTATLIGSFLIRRALRPIGDIQKTADHIANGQLAARINEEAQQRNEIRNLSENLNQTFSRLESMFERQKRFTSDASHELRTPIAVILGYCQMALEKGRSPDEIREAVQACRRAGERMKNLTNDLLELSRIESGEISFELSDCSVREIAEEALELVEPLASDKGITLHEEIEEVSIRANGDRLWQVLVNLFNNAIRHTPNGNSITLRSKTGDGRLNLAVIDEGEGIPAQDLPHIFDRFYRVDHSRNRQKGGSGLGLAISDTIIKAHGGTIDVQSEIGGGTTFTISLPLAT